MDEMSQASLYHEHESEKSKKYKRKLRENPSPIYAVNLVSTIHKDGDDAVSLVKRNGVKFACGKGCSYCCDTRVEVLPSEVFYIAKKLEETRGSEIPQLIKDLEKHSQKAEGILMGDYKIPCVFLRDGQCSIYDFRPFMCRKFNSLDVEPCKEYRAIIPESEPLVIMSAAISTAARNAYVGKKLSATPSEFGQALLVALTDKDAFSAWSRGAEVFPELPETAKGFA